MDTHSTQNLANSEQGFFIDKTFKVTDQIKAYRGRFAPSPSGPLHFGSLIAAVASYCQAKANNGTWLVRMEDIDPPREQSGADHLIIECLAAHALYSDEPVLYQSQRYTIYDSAIKYLAEHNLIFYCTCTRKKLRVQLEQLQNHNLTTTIYPGTCRKRLIKVDHSATRLLIRPNDSTFSDGIYGEIRQNLATEVGDFVLQRRDNLYSYQLAVVIDDIAQGISEVVRGVDLLDSTPRQNYLYECLGYNKPEYVHLPLVLMQDGRKLSKQTGATSLDNKLASDNLVSALEFLGQKPLKELRTEKPGKILEWAVCHWDMNKISTKSLPI